MGDEFQEVWCHICNSRQNGRWSVVHNNELECSHCGSNFVENLNQDVEAFLSTDEPHESTSSNSVSTNSNNLSQSSQSIQIEAPIIDQNAIVQQVLQRVLGINPSSSSISQPIPISGGTLVGGFRTSPMGIVIRQNVDAVPRNLMGLLQSVASIRQHSISPDPNALDNAQFEQFLHHILMNETSHSGTSPASQETISCLPREIVTAETNVHSLGDCCISQEPFELGDVVVSLACGHKYKEEPITHWLKMHATCPLEYASALKAESNESGISSKRPINIQG